MSTMHGAGDDLELLAAIAQGIMDLDAVGHVEAFTMPYPNTAQLALDRLGLFCLLSGQESPAGIPDLVRWGWRKPLHEWPIRTGDASARADALLVDPLSRRPSRLCSAWALEQSEDAPLHLARSHLQAVAEKCGSPAATDLAITQLIDQPVIVTAQKAKMSSKPGIGGLWHLLADSYHRAPEWYFRKGVAAICAACGDLTVPVSGDLWWCPWDSALGVATTVRSEIELRDGVWQLDNVPRRYLATCGRRTTALRRQLRDAGVRETSLCLDESPRLEVVVRKDETWSVFADDRSSPGLVSAAADRAVPSHPAHRKVIAVPDSWAADGRLEQLHAVATPGTTAMTDRELIATAAGEATQDA